MQQIFTAWSEARFLNDMHSYKFNVTHFCNTFLQMALLIEVDTLTKTMMIRKVM